LEIKDKFKIRRHNLLRQQVEKHFKGHLITPDVVQGFIEDVEQSYESFEEQIRMAERSYAISTHQLYDSNLRCKEDKKNQMGMISSLNSAIRMLEKNISSLQKSEAINEGTKAIDLVNYVEKLAEKILKVHMEKENLTYQLERKSKTLYNCIEKLTKNVSEPIQLLEKSMLDIENEVTKKQTILTAKKYLNEIKLVVNQVINETGVSNTAQD
jgi:Mg2+ and Co2+ transporter CorA